MNAPHAHERLTDEALIDLAKKAADNAHCPYSNFHVGAALQTTDGRVFVGCNVENASYGATICAERVAIGNMVAAGARQPRRIVVYTPTPTPSSPCGVCRQVLLEFTRELEVILACDGPTARYTLAELLPHPFVL